MEKILKKCVHHNQVVKHINWKGKVKPNCLVCDGYGKDAIKNNWDCYEPKIYFKIKYERR